MQFFWQRVLQEKVERLIPGAPILPTRTMSVLTTVAQSSVKQIEKIKLNLHPIYSPAVLARRVVHTVSIIILLVYIYAVFFLEIIHLLIEKHYKYGHVNFFAKLV